MSEPIIDEGTVAASVQQVEIKVFGRWDPNEVQIEDISLSVSSYSSRPFGWVASYLCNKGWSCVPFTLRTTLPSRRSMPCFSHTQQDGMPWRDSGRPRYSTSMRTPFCAVVHRVFFPVVPHCWAFDKCSDEAWQEQWQENAGTENCASGVWDHPSLNRRSESSCEYQVQSDLFTVPLVPSFPGHYDQFAVVTIIVCVDTSHAVMEILFCEKCSYKEVWLYLCGCTCCYWVQMDEFPPVWTVELVRCELQSWLTSVVVSVAEDMSCIDLYMGSLRHWLICA